MYFVAADVGGTKALLAKYKVEGEKLVELRREKFDSHSYSQFDEILEKFLKEESDPPHSVCIGIAGAIKNGVCKPANLPWEVDAQKLSKTFNIEKVHLINDLVANAYGINALETNELYTLNKGDTVKDANQALISAGTGLGEAGIFYCKGDYVPSPSEGGHSDFSPRNDLEVDLLKYLWKKYGHASKERVLSGHGMINLYDFLVETGVEKKEDKAAELMKKEDPAKVISDLGISGECKACKHALTWFCELYGAEAGNLALNGLATGGVYIGGGIAPKIIDELKKEGFMRAFTDKGRFSTLLSSIPVNIILAEDTALRGAAYHCKKAA